MAALASCSFLNRSIIAIPGLSLGGGLAGAKLDGLGGTASDVTWATRCFLTGITGASVVDEGSSDFRFLASSAWLCSAAGWYSYGISKMKEQRMSTINLTNTLQN